MVILKEKHRLIPGDNVPAIPALIFCISSVYCSVSPAVQVSSEEKNGGKDNVRKESRFVVIKQV
jgi:hypothetical protein